MYEVGNTGNTVQPRWGARQEDKDYSSVQSGVTGTETAKETHGFRLVDR